MGDNSNVHHPCPPLEPGSWASVLNDHPVDMGINTAEPHPDRPEVTPGVEGLGMCFDDPAYNTKPWVIVYGNLKYQVLREPDENSAVKHAVSMEERTTVTVQAEGWTKPNGGRKFWSTRDAGHHFEYKAGMDQVVKGWEKGCN